MRLTDNPNYVAWKVRPRVAEQSAWDDQTRVDGRTFVDPASRQTDGREMLTTMLLDDGGDYAAHTSWFEGNFGHFVHDHIPTIATLRSFLPSRTKFLLVDTSVTRNILGALDPDFAANRIVWIRQNQLVEIRNGGTLTVAIPKNLPNMAGCCQQFDFMRQWAAERLAHNGGGPDQQVREEDRFVVFYRRLPNGDLHHGRMMERAHEREVMRRIRAAMKKYGRKERFVEYSGDHNGRRLTIDEQRQVFRRASTIIGPHGSGVGGNLIWTNPYAQTCNERVQLLEFVPDEESGQVQMPFAHYWSQWRKWPIDYHTLLYLPQSTSEATFINLQDLDSALDEMWGPAIDTGTS